MLPDVLPSPPTPDSHLSSTMDSFHFGAAATPQPKSEDAMDIPFASFDDDLDHRKRRRNRTTQSCWSCHQAKRKCDRKRPCSRCIQLGLTGLCVYETDDPASRDDPSLSETQRLRKRIAELEALVREMKNKPHPRWADKVSSAGGIGVDKWHTRAKYVVGSNSAGAPDGFDEYQYRFPPLEGGPGHGSYDSFSPSSSSSTVLPPPFDDSRRLSIASSVSSNSSPRTPYSYNVGTGILANPCGCLSSAPNTARALAGAIRQVVLESGITHPYSEGCKVLALVRELESAANDHHSPPSHSHSINGNSTSSMYYPPPPDPHSNSNSPHPPSSNTSAGSSPHNHPVHQLPHPLQITPPTPLPSVASHRTQQQPHISYANYPMSSMYHSYHSPGSDDSNPPTQPQQPTPPTVPSMAQYSEFAGVPDYSNNASPHTSPSKYALAGVV